MKTKYFEATVAYPYKEGVLIRVHRRVKNSKPIKQETHNYFYSWNSEHIYTTLKRFSKMIELHHINMLKYFRELNKDENN